MKKTGNLASRKKRGGRKRRGAGERSGIDADFQVMKVGTNLRNKFLKSPSRPFPGAQYTVRQMASTIGQEVGFTSVGGNTAGTLSQSSNAAVVKFAAAFQLSDWAQSSTYASVFDQYRVELLRYFIKSGNNAIGLAGAAAVNQVNPTMYVVVDRDDNNALASYGAALQYDNVIELEGQDNGEITLVPSLTPAIYAGGAFSAYATERSDRVWIDIANTSVPMYGIKGVIGTLAAGAVSYDWTWLVSVEAIVSFRNTR
jgi:hypothetical protein